MAKTDVRVALVGEDGNAFAIIGRVSRALKQAGHRELASEFTSAAMRQKSYDDLLCLVLEYVEELEDEEDTEDDDNNEWGVE